MRFEDLEIGKCYTHHDDGLYKVIDKGADWVLMWKYSCNHKVAMPWIHKSDDDFFNGMEEETNEWETEIFDNLVYCSNDLVKDGD